MLNEIDSLSHNIARLIAIVDTNRQQLQRLETQLERTRAERDAAREDLERSLAERDALRNDRDSLSSKIEDAQVRLNAILEKLPRARTDENQLDLLSSPPVEPRAGENE